MGLTCIICGGEKRKPQFRSNGYVIVRCQNCHFRFVDPTPAASELAQFYNQAYAVDLRNYSEHMDDQRLRELERFHPPGRLLEIGASYGHWLNLARARGWTAAGIEVSREAARYAREYFGLDVQNADLIAAQVEDASCDAVVMWHVLEHVSNPAEQLRRVREILRPGGVVAIRVPNGASLGAIVGRQWWFWMSPPAHLWFFSPVTLSNFLAQHGFEVVHIGTMRGDGLDPYQHLARAATGELASLARTLRRREGGIEHSWRDTPGVSKDVSLTRHSPPARARRTEVLERFGPVALHLDKATSRLTRRLEQSGFGDELVGYARRPA